MNSFSFKTTPEIHFGAGQMAQIGVLGRPLGASVLMITDPGLLDTGIPDRAAACLRDAGVAVQIFSDVMADPTEAAVHAAAAQARGCNGVIGLGGGSSMDVAKLAAMLAGCDQPLADAFGVGNATGPRLPLMLVPTTAGTGSEVTPISIITTGTHEKMGVVSPVILPDIALLDPELTYGLPGPATAATGIDAMVHAIEAYASASPNNNPISRGLAVQALQLMGPALERAVHDGDPQARADMLLGSMLAGQAFANSPVAAVHALAYPLGGHYHIPHGLSNALVLPHVLRFNAQTAPAPYTELAPHLFPDQPGLSADGFADALADLSQRCGLDPSLRAHGVTHNHLPMLAEDAMKQTRLLINNPREVTYDDALAIYEAAY